MSSHKPYNKKDTTDVKKCEINVTVGNGQNMKCEIRGLVNMKTQGRETINLAKVLYVPQSFNNLLSLSMNISKGDTMGVT